MRKYKNIPVEADGKRFASKREHRRYVELKLMQLGHEIEDLKCQPRYEFVVNNIKVGHYTADFSYIDRRTGEAIVEDVKSEPTKTTAYRLRKMLMKACHGIEVVEV